MVTASVCTIGDEILIGQIVDTNSAGIAGTLQSKGIKVNHMVSIGDNHEQIISQLTNELKYNDIVIVTGGLGPTKDDITKKALAELCGCSEYVDNAVQSEINKQILTSRGLDKLKSNVEQSVVPACCEVIPNKKGTAPIMVFPMDGKKRIYSLPGVPSEAMGALPDILSDIEKHFKTESIYHRTIMTYGLAESALSELIAPWEDALPEYIHLAYLPNPSTGVRLRLSSYGIDKEAAEIEFKARIEALKPYLGDNLYSLQDDTIQAVIGRLLKGTGKTVSAAESCTGGRISHLLTTVSGSSEYYLGSVTSYAIPVKTAVLGVNKADIDKYGVVSSQVAAQMAEGVKKLTGSTYSVSTTGLAEGCDERNPAGTVWIGVSGPNGTLTYRYVFNNDRVINISRFTSTALDLLRRYIINDKQLKINK